MARRAHIERILTKAEEDTPQQTPEGQTPAEEWTQVSTRPGVDLDIRHRRTYVAKDKASRFGKETHPSRNRRVCGIEPNTEENPLDYEVLAYVDNDELYLNKNTTPVILYQGDWFELEISDKTKTPYLGVQRDDIHEYDVPTSDEGSTEASTTDQETSDEETRPTRKEKGKSQTKGQRRLASEEHKNRLILLTPAKETESPMEAQTPMTPTRTERDARGFHSFSAASASRSRTRDMQTLAMTPLQTPS